MLGRVLEKQSDKFVVDCIDGILQLSSRGKNKDQGIYVGDEVEFENQVIEKVLERKSVMIRPNLANLSKLYIVIASVPKPDFAIVDKLILFSFFYNVEPVIVVNKIDICDKLFLNSVENTYIDVAKIFFVSAKTGDGLENLHKDIMGNICGFAGQSAVGKSALICSIYPQSNAIIGEISKKIQRGKNTTRSAKLYKLENDTYIADTPGFSSLDILYLPIKYFELCYYYPDFLKYHNNCKYKSCTHTNEDIKDCGIKQALNDNKLDKLRYDRYLAMFEILKKDFIKNHG